ncbi:MAG: TonB-dependent receptor [Sphingomonas sp.]|uniref:TonB-dependent receptor n=1 Tax=Sphingomonas sp. TaxID=28214 RepID=UPI001ACD31AA|nr:TonB-dependent receptor [Sphingomonas sp.]MBN8815153.1 TonB-dependent receptor [Sphingomonas sp.]
MTKTRLLCACALSAVAIAAALPAAAQTTPTTPAPAPLSPEDDRSNDIVITAQGRSQQLSDVPVAVSAVNADTLAKSGATDIRALNQIAPSLLVSSTGNESNGSARLRGIGTVGDNPGLESSVAVFVDGVYRSRSGIGLNELGDIDRIEVLRGPQGTLFGRNASAGIISIYSKKPAFDFGAGGEVTYGNYNYWRVAGNVNVPLGETLAARVDGVYVSRDGFYKNVTDGTRINNRDRYFVRGQLLYEPSSSLSVRLIGDYTHRNEACCTAVYIDQTVAPANRNLLTTANSIIPVLTALGEPTAAFSNPYSRNVYLSPGRSSAGTTTDWGVSGQIDLELGGGAKLTSITAYRGYENYQASDTDYSYVDILYRAPGKDAGARQFKTFSQELRLQGEAFGGKLDWLVGAYYANEDLEVRDNLKFGSQYGRFASCRIINGGGLAFAFDPTASGCIRTTLRPTVSGAFGAAGPTILAAFDRLDQINNVGDTRSVYDQNSSNYAFFTHNIFEIAPGLKLTVGLRWTHETKKLNASFGNNNTLCQAQQTALTPFLTNAALSAVAGGLISLSCQGNSTAELNGVSINSKRSENELTGTGILSYKVTPRLLAYASYARGYKAGGFNLDRSALKNPIQIVGGLPTTTFAAAGGAQALVNNLQFDKEINTAFEIGLKYSSRGFSLNVAAFRQLFSNFQLNTFNGSVFLVQNIDACSSSLGGADMDTSSATGACTGKVIPGVKSQGVELEAVLNPTRYLTVNAGFTYADTSYRKNLVGNSAGAPLDAALRMLPGDNLSNAPETVTTMGVSWTPPIGGTGLSALFYVDGRLTSDYNTGSDLFPQKEQDSFFVMNARVGLRGADSRWSLEFWAQNVLNAKYTQVAFSSPFQAGGANATFTPDRAYPGGAQIFSAFLAEPRTYGVTLRGKF